MTRPAISRASAVTADRLLTVEEVAVLLNTGVRFVRRLTAERRITFVKLGDRHVRIPESAVRAFISAGTVNPVSVAWSNGRVVA
ncbi:excisionase family DNA-binding protein [Catellatospora coxensis]|uniref:Helix-turn-helix domain-containing protein n=1 Tax=Catellatospora coxensis TaxID=310354 RepID=A0A8J3PCQ7_9ACTN|nr:excisionase family DNA-binding protein [Catellatospora coxensis]GIG11628.1 hypothetical protein Cco03nite_83280 [Catellatospora coxensis]